MKLTWFGGTAIRIHIGGQILLVDGEMAGNAIDANELRSGANRVFALAGDPDMAALDLMRWRRKPPSRLMDEPQVPQRPQIFRIGIGSLLIDAEGEAPLVLVGEGQPPDFGRWTDGAVVVLFGKGEIPSVLGRSLLHSARPKVLALASDDAGVDLAVAKLGLVLDGAALVALEPGLALEV